MAVDVMSSRLSVPSTKCPFNITSHRLIVATWCPFDHVAIDQVGFDEVGFDDVSHTGCEAREPPENISD